MPPTLQLTFFATLEICIDGISATGFRSLKAQALLCYLASSGRGQSRSALSGLLWGDSPEEQARASLRQAISNLNDLCEGALIASRQSVVFNRQQPYTLDTETFEHAATRLIAQPGLLELHAALDLYRGDFLDGFVLRNAPDFETWTLAMRGHYRQLALQAHNAVAHYWQGAGDFTRAIAYQRRLLQIEPWHEESHRALMGLLAQTGQRNAALEQYRLLSQLLVDELGVEPDTATQALFEEIKKRREVSVPPVAQPPVLVPFPAQGESRTGEIAGGTQEQRQESHSARPAFVGRVSEIAALTSALAKAGEGKGQLRFVIGSAGQGKSTLVQEFVRQAQAAEPHLLAITGHCNAYTGSSDPYLPFRQMLGLLTGEVESQWAQGRLSHENVPDNAPDNARRLWYALPDILAALVKYAPDLIGPFVSASALLERAAGIVQADAPWLTTLQRLNASQQSSPLDERRIFAQFSDLLKAISNSGSKVRPFVIILEDLHWADVPSCGLLFHLSRTLGASSILIIATYRPAEVPAGVQNGTHPLATLLGEFKRQFGDIWLDLDAHNAAKGRSFVEEYLDTEPNLLDAPFRAAFFQRTGGHALFTVELLRELQARGDLFQDGDGRWLARSQIDWQALPAKIEGVIEKHLSALEGRAQAILRAAAVQGEIFAAEVIAHLLQQEEQGVVSYLSQELGQKQRLVSSQEQLWLGTRRLSRYAFRHFLFQQYLYQTLDEAERIYLHEAVGNALEKLYGEATAQIATQLAYHFRQAGLHDKAIATLLLAGQRAKEMAAHQEAIQQLSQGLKILDALPITPVRQHQRLDYLIALATAMDIAGNYDHAEIERILLEARDLCQQQGASQIEWSILYGLYMTYFYRGQHPQAFAMGEELLQISQQEVESEPALIAFMILGAEANALGDFIGSIEYLERALALFDPEKHHDLARRYGGFDVRVELLTGLAQGKWMLGYAEQARQLNESAMQIGVEANSPYILAQALIQLTYQMEFHRLFDECANQAAALSRLASEHAYHLMVCHANMYAGMAMVEQGLAEAGLARVSEAIADLRAGGNTMGQTHFANLQARCLAAVGRLQEAVDMIDEALASVATSGERFYVAELLRLRGEYLWKQGAPPAEVVALFEEAIAVARQQAAKMWELRATISLCTLWQQQGKAAAAHARLADLYAWFTEGFDTPDLQAARALLDQLEKA